MGGGGLGPALCSASNPPWKADCLPMFCTSAQPARPIPRLIQAGDWALLCAVPRILPGRRTACPCFAQAHSLQGPSRGSYRRVIGPCSVQCLESSLEGGLPAHVLHKRTAYKAHPAAHTGG